MNNVKTVDKALVVAMGATLVSAIPPAKNMKVHKWAGLAAFALAGAHIFLHKKSWR